MFISKDQLQRKWRASIGGWRGKIGAFVLGLMTSHLSLAQTVVNIQGSPAAWRVQNYVGANGVMLYFTPSTCSIGSLGFAPGTSTDDVNRFWAFIMAAKIAGQDVGIYYYVSGSSCYIQSFYLPP